MSGVRHDPTVMSGGRAHWIRCGCGWDSGLRPTITSAHLQFGQHLAALADPETETDRSEGV